MNILLFFVSMFPMAAIAGCEKDSSVVVSHCFDGDTCNIQIQNKSDKIWMKVRLFGLDAPEVARGSKPGQPFGDAARDALNAKIKGKTVVIKQADLDHYNRPVVEIQFQQENINLWLVEQGLAEVYRGPSKRLSRADYFEAESRARVAKKGIWSQEKYIPPGDFRKK